jgi:acyl-CoA dehydrogenase
MFKTRAGRDGDEWVLNGWKYFSSNARTASFLIVMAVTNTDVSAYNGMSMFLVPTGTPGVNIVRNVGLAGEPLNEGFHALIHYNEVRVPAEAVVSHGEQSVVFVTREAGRLERIPVTVGRRGGGEVELRSGLEPGTRYVAKGALLLLNQLQLAE